VIFYLREFCSLDTHNIEFLMSQLNRCHKNVWIYYYYYQSRVNILKNDEFNHSNSESDFDRLIIKLSFNINLLTQLKYSVSIFWLNLNTRFQHSDLIWYWSWINTWFEFSTQLVKKSKMTSKELNIEIFSIFRLCIIFLHYLFDRKS